MADVSTNPGSQVVYNPNNPFNVGVAGTGNFGGGAMPTTPLPLSSNSPQANQAVPPPIVATSSAANDQINGIKQFAQDQQNGVQQQTQTKAANQTAQQQSQQAHYDANPFELRPGETTNAQKTGTYDLRVAPLLQKTGASDYSQGTQPKAQFYFFRNPDNSITWKDANGQTLPTNPYGDNYNSQAPETLPQFQNGQIASFNPNNPPWGQQPAVGGTTGTDLTNSFNTATQNNTTALTNSLANLQAQRDQQNQDIQTKLSEITNGTFPLTPAQQGLLNSTTAQYNQLIAQQKIANQTYEQGMLVMEARTGEAQGGTTTAMGNYQNAVNTGLAKIGEIENKMTTALANLQSGFQSDDLKMVQAAYDDFNKYADSKQKTITDISTATQTALNDMKTATMTALQDNITNTLNSDKFTYQQKQDAIDNALKNSQLDETKLKDLRDYQLKEETLAVQKQANDMLSGAFNNVKGISQTLSGGSANPAYQQAFLAAFPPLTQTNIKGLADYSFNPASFTTSARQAQGNLTQGQLIGLAKQYDPSYNEGSYAIRNSFLKNWQVGGQNSVIQAANTSIDHLTKLWSQAQNLGNANSGDLGPFTSKYNSVAQWLNEGAQNPNVNQFKQTAIALAGEMARIYKNGSGSNAAPSDEEIKTQLGILTTNVSPQNAKGLIENGVNLMTDRLTSAMENYNSVMGKQPTSILYQTALDNVKKLQSEGLNIDISKLNPSPYTNMTTDQFLNSTGGSTTANQDNSGFFGSLLQNVNNATNLTTGQ